MGGHRPRLAARRGALLVIVRFRAYLQTRAGRLQLLPMFRPRPSAKSVSAVPWSLASCLDVVTDAEQRRSTPGVELFPPQITPARILPCPSASCRPRKRLTVAVVIHLAMAAAGTQAMCGGGDLGAPASLGRIIPTDTNANLLDSRSMRILYGVVGEGMGHATRSVVISTLSRADTK
jgi:hypothetical protein